MQIFDCFIILGCHLFIACILVFLFLDIFIFKKKKLNAEYSQNETRIIIAVLIITLLIFSFYAYILISWYDSSYNSYLIVEAIMYFSLSLMILLLIVGLYLLLNKFKKYNIKLCRLVILGLFFTIFMTISEAFLIEKGVNCILDVTNSSFMTFTGDFEVLSGGMYEHEGIVLDNSKIELVSNVEGIYEGSFYGEILYGEHSKHVLSITILNDH